MTAWWMQYGPWALDLTALAASLGLLLVLAQNRRRYGQWVLRRPMAPEGQAFLQQVFSAQTRKAHQSLSDMLHGEFEALHRLASDAALTPGGLAGDGPMAAGATTPGPDRKLYAQAMRLAAGGQSPESIAAQLGLRRGEAQLVVNLQRHPGRRP
jgi:hypothetical protein